MITLTANCKICHKPLELKVDESCPGEWIEKLIPGATCNRCHSLNMARNKAIDEIKHAITMLDPSRLKGHTREHEIRMTARDILTNATKGFAATMTDFYGAPEIDVWNPLVVDSFMQNPERWWEVLQDFRHAIREKIKRAKKNFDPQV